MTEIYLHGILGKKYGKKHKLCLSKPKDLIFAMEANYVNFVKDLKDLASKNIHYTFIVDNEWCKTADANSVKKMKKINFVPVILGSGPVVAGSAITWAMVAMFVISVVASAVISYIMAGKVDYPSVPGASASTNAFSKSLSFSNRENTVEQGNPVPLVYGRIKVGSFVIQSTVKSFPLSLNLVDEFNNTSSKKSANQAGTITSQSYNSITT